MYGIIREVNCILNKQCERSKIINRDGVCPMISTSLKTRRTIGSQFEMEPDIIMQWWFSGAHSHDYCNQHLHGYGVVLCSPIMHLYIVGSTKDRGANVWWWALRMHRTAQSSTSNGIIYYLNPSLLSISWMHQNPPFNEEF